MNVRSKSAHVLGTLVMYIWIVGGAMYYLVRFSRSFYAENEVQIRNAVTSLFGG